jgi:hypothetical protein
MLAGYDAIKAPAHNTAWIVRASLSATLMGGITTPCRGADTLRPVTSFCAMMVGRSVQ